MLAVNTFTYKMEEPVQPSAPVEPVEPEILDKTKLYVSNLDP